MYHLGSFMEDFSYSFRIYEAILMSYFTSIYKGSAEKSGKSKSASKLREQSGFTVSWKYWLNLCSLRRLRDKKCKKCIWSFIGGILRYELSVYIRNDLTEKYFNLDCVKNKKNKISTNKKTS